MVKKETDKKESVTVADKNADKKEKAIKDTLEEIQSRFGEGAIMKLGEAKTMNVDFISTGSISLDIALGGGIP